MHECMEVAFWSSKLVNECVEGAVWGDIPP
jgi:hypothetical protein